MNKNRKQIRREAAEERMKACAKLTPKQRLAALDKAFGEGQGAQKERARLQRMLTGAAVTTSPVVEEAVSAESVPTETAPKKSAKSKSKKS